MVDINEILSAIERSTGASLGQLGAAFQESTTPFASAQQRAAKSAELEAFKGAQVEKKEDRARKEAQRKALNDFFEIVKDKRAEGIPFSDIDLFGVSDQLDSLDFETFVTLGKAKGFFADIEAKQAETALDRSLSQLLGGGDLGAALESVPQIDIQEERLNQAIIIAGQKRNPALVTALTDQRDRLTEVKRAAEKATEVETAKAKVKLKGQFPKAKAALRAQQTQTNIIVNSITEIEGKLDSLVAGFPGAVLSQIPGTDANDVRNNLQTILANLGFDALQAMRDNSPTGGALGQISEREIAFLQALTASLAQDQSPEQFALKLRQAKERIKEFESNRNLAFNDVFGEFIVVGDIVAETTIPKQTQKEIPNVRTFSGGRLSP